MSYCRNDACIHYFGLCISLYRIGGVRMRERELYVFISFMFAIYFTFMTYGYLIMKD
jgi:hypothetical protein